MNMRSILEYDTNRINAKCNSSTKKNMKQKIFGNATVRDYPNLLKSEIFFHCFLHIFLNPHSNVTIVCRPTHRSIGVFPSAMTHSL